MRKHFVRLSIALLTFIVGVSAATIWLGRSEPPSADPPAARMEILTTASDPALFGPTGCNFTIPETPEEKAVRLAEEFVARNGYTDLSPDRDNLSYETIEWESDVEEMLKQRRDSLERKAYGIYYSGRGREPGWTVVFRPSLRYRNGDEVVGAGRAVEWGRAVTMNKDFENLRVEHKSFPLGNVQKRF